MTAKIGSFHAFKWRFAMAMVAQARNANIGVADIRARFNSLMPERNELSAAAGWTRAQIDTIDTYADVQYQLSFPALADIRGTFSSTFREIDVMYGSYELAECCPILVLQARQ